jgi:CRISPR-associated endonuclease Cas1
MIPKRSVITLVGYGIQVRVDRGHLLIEDGIGADRRTTRIPRVGHGLKRLVVIGSDGVVSLAALRWLSDQQAAFVMLERDGSVLATTGPVRPSDARLRRAQALAHQSGAALAIAKELIRAKLAGQESLVRYKLKDGATADTIAGLADRLSMADNLDAIRFLEAQAAGSYWSVWNLLPILFPRQDQKRVPEHWTRFGTRKSVLTGSPRLATNPPNAILNYCYALLESESRLALATHGLDPGIGMLHVDTPKRDSLACDIMEAVRPSVDAWLLDWIMREPLRRSDYFEQRNGNCRLMAPFATKLSETAPTWGKLVAPWAEFVVHTLWNSIRHAKSERPVATRLTQQHRREAKGQPSFPKIETPKPDRLCRWCGKKIRQGKSYCVQCAPLISRENFDSGRKEAHRPEFLAKRADTMAQHRRKIREWKVTDLPAWLTRSVYVDQIQPRLANVPKTRIRTALSVSEPYASYIQSGKRIPHPRHWERLAGMAGLD